MKSRDLPDVRRALIESLKGQLTPLGVLDNFQVAGVFVNWWDSIKYDLKTIMTNGWSPSLIPDPYIIKACFQAEADELERLEAAIGEAETAVDEATEAAQELLEYELDEDEKLMPKLMRDQLQAAINDSQSTAERQPFRAALKAIQAAEKRRSDLKRTLREKQFELEIKILLKKFGPEDETAESRRLLIQAEAELAELEAIPKPDRTQQRKINGLKRDRQTLQERIAAIERLTKVVGGVISEAEAKELVLQKHHDLVADQLARYLNAEKRTLLGLFENLWQKYANSAQSMESAREESFAMFKDYLDKLTYLD